MRHLTCILLCIMCWPAIALGQGYSGPIQGTVFNDLNDNGSKEGGEPGIQGVGVSDTIDLVISDANGNYTLPNSNNNATLLYISIPAGYAKDTTWYRHINAASTSADFDFALKTSNESDPFEFIQITDVHIGRTDINQALYQDAIAQMTQLTNPPELLIATGDLVNTGATTSQYDEYVAAIATSTVPLFSVFGNHDKNDNTVDNYRTYLGPDYYSFSYNECHFLIVNSVYRTAQQNAWIAQDLALLRQNKKLFIFQHYSPSQNDHSEFAGYQTDAVFTGHWHSQHSVQVGNMKSYNTPPLLFGGIDFSPAGFKIISVNNDNITTQMRFLADGKRLQIVYPNQSMIVAQNNLPIVVNAYETSSMIAGVTYSIEHNGNQIDSGALIQEGDWTWTKTITGLSIPIGTSTVYITVTNDKGQINSASADFYVNTPNRATPTPTNDWPQFGGGPKRGGLANNATITPPLGLAWIANTQGTIDFGSPVLYQGNIYIGVKDRRDFEKCGVLALNATDGSTQWFTQTPASVSHAVAVDANQVYANSHGGILHILNRNNGQEIYAKTLGSAYQRFLYGAPLLNNNRVFTGTYGYFAGFDSNTGNELWNKVYDDEWISCNASPATDGNILLVAGRSGTYCLRGVSPTDGNVIWQYPTGGLQGSPVITGNNVVFTTYNGKIVAASLTTGSQIWSKNLDGSRSVTTPAVAGNIVIAGGTGSVKAYRLDNGNEIWTFNIGTSALKMAAYDHNFNSLIGSPTIVNQIVYVPSGDGKLYALDLNNGQMIWSMNFDAPIISAPCISGNALFLTTYDGHVYALTDRSAFGLPGDLDADGVLDQDDNCPDHPNPDQADNDQDGTGNTCDICPNDPQNDQDNDGVCGDIDQCPNTPPGTPVSEVGCPFYNADFDADGDVDLEDFGHFQACMTGSGIPINDPNCLDADFSDDNDVDLNDFNIFHDCFSGPNIPANTHCQNQ
ncbi:MAG: outer membrane protein assembly factor BamB family protein [Planctomycetota bacterium]